ncbi:MAG: DUF6125 family protein [Syntrophales bacterium]
MNHRENIQPSLRRKALDILKKIPLSKKQELLIQNWMSHDACWFMAVTRTFGMEATNRINKTAAYEIGKVESRRIFRELALAPIAALDDCLLVLEVFVNLLGPRLLDYDIVKLDDRSCQMHVKRCFAYENVSRAGVADQYECGIFARIEGWLKGLSLDYEIDPIPEKCLKVQNRQCVYTISLKWRAM